MKRAVGCCVAGIVLLLLPGCGKLIEWGKENFYQGEEYAGYLNAVTPYIRDITIYDQLTTQAHFDVLWLSDAVRTAYADLHSARLSKSAEHREMFLRRQLEENEYFISFYILSLYDIKLGNPDSHWTLFLEVDNKTYQPTEVTVVELPYEYQIFFDKRFNRFKEPYQLRFSAFDQENNPIISPTTQKIMLHARSAKKGYTFSWNLQKESSDVVHNKKESPAQPTVRKKRRCRS